MGSGIFEIPEGNLKKFEAALEKLSRKAVKLGGDPFLPVVFSYKMVDVGRAQAVKVYEVLLDCTIPQINGWEFIGRIDHANGELGNIVRALPNKEIPEKYRHTGCKCDHCNINRFRRDTYILQNVETQETQQVGSSCLKDFLGGNDPVKLAKMAELLSYANECAKGYTNSVGEDRRYLVLNEYLQFVSMATRMQGYFVSRSMAQEKGMESTSGKALGLLHHVHMDYSEEISARDEELAEKAIEWAAGLSESGKPMNDYEHNINVLAVSGTIEYRSCGYAASMIIAYQKAHGLLPEYVKKTSNYLGEKGAKIDLVASLKTISPTNGRFPGVRYGFEDANGNLVVWFTGVELDVRKGQSVRLQAKVKDHNEYNNVKSTIVSHCSIETV
jgi:hypothetical protein